MRALFFLVSLIMLSSTADAQRPLSPDVLYAELFRDVQLGRVFSDGKTFADCVPRRDPEAILADYRAIRKNPAARFSLALFVEENFIIPDAPHGDTVHSQKDLLAHIQSLWLLLRRQSDTAVKGSSLLPLPHPYIIPGGRFREIYYWDSYFTMLGLRESREYDLLESMVRNFAYLIDSFGHMPNGNRSYYLSRSQPPVFSLMLDLLAAVKGNAVYQQYRGSLEQEYRYWMDQSAPTQHLVHLPDGSRLNRYWDQLDTPRPEAYLEDVETASRLPEAERPALFRNLRSAAESGWDFSSRWQKRSSDLSTTQTTDIIPVDLNCLLYHIEFTLGRAWAESGDRQKAAFYQEAAAARKAAIQNWCWSPEQHWYMDYNLATQKRSSEPTLAGMFPFFLQLSSKEKCRLAAAVVRESFLKNGGVVTTPVASKEQWDAPNGWAPLQWVTIRGLHGYGEEALARTIAERWVALNWRVFHKTGRLMEKYDVVDANRPGGGGEYPSQDGFGWTNGVLLALINQYRLKE